MAASKGLNNIHGCAPAKNLRFKFPPIMKTHPPITFASLALLAALMASCASSPGHIDIDGAQAAVEIRNSTETGISQAVIETFLLNGYQRESSYGLTFEKRGNVVRQLEYASYMGGAAVMRVRVAIEPISSSSHLVTAKAYTVTNLDSTFGASEKPVRGPRKRHYQKLLEEVRARLQAP